MDKFNLHDGLRIFLPGLLFCVLIHWISTGTLQNVGDVALPAIFVGILIDLLFKRSCESYFNNLAKYGSFDFGGEKLFIHAGLRNSISSQLIKYNHSDEGKTVSSYRRREQVVYITRNFMSRLSDSQELNSFRMPKSYGVLCFNSSVVCIIIAIMLLINQMSPYLFFYKLPLHGFGYLVSFLLFITALVFFSGCYFYFERSLIIEISFWSSLKDEDLLTIKKLVHRCTELKIGVQNNGTLENKSSFWIRTNAWLKKTHLKGLSDLGIFLFFFKSKKHDKDLE